MKLVSWNIRRGKKERLAAQIEALRACNAHIIALQEVSPKFVQEIKSKLYGIGFKHSEDSYSQCPRPERLCGPRAYAEIIASHWAVKLLPTTEMCWPERVLSVTIDSPYGSIEVHTVHVAPGAGNEWIKIRILRGIYSRLATRSNRLRILCGDFNAPREELKDGHIVTWGQRLTKAGKIKFIGHWGSRWDRGERDVLEGLKKFDLIDTYRHVKGPAAKDFSWFSTRKKAVLRRRFDHVFASKALNPIECRYVHTARTYNGLKKPLSDHSPIEVKFAPIRL